MPIMIGLAIGAAMGGGIAALRGGKTDDILKGALIGGATGAAGAGIAPLLSGGAGAVGASGANVAPAVANLYVEGAGTAAASAATASPTASSIANPGFFGSGIGKFISENKMPLGLGAAGLLMSNKGNSQSSQPESDSYIRPYEFSQVENPDYQGAGTPYFNQAYKAKTPIKASDFGATTVANGGVIRMAEGGDVGIGQFEQDQFNRPQAMSPQNNPTLEALASIQQAQQSYQPPAVSQGITQPLIQPQMAQVQQRYATPQRAVPADFQYQAPQFVSYGIGGGGGSGGGYGSLVDPTTGKLPTTGRPISGVMPVTGTKDKPFMPTVNLPYMAGATAPYSPETPTSIIPSTGEFRAPVPETSLNPAGVVGYDHNPLKSENIGQAVLHRGTSAGESDAYTVPVSPYANTGYGGIGSESGGNYSSGLGYSGVELDPGYNNLKVPTSSENLANIYQEMLGRAPDASGIESFSNMAPDQVISAIIASPEYQATNGPPPEPTYYYGGQEMYTPEYAQVRPDDYYDPNQGFGGGEADGGLIADKHPRYAMGGGIGGYYPEPDDSNHNFGGIGALNQGPQYPMQGIGYRDGGIIAFKDRGKVPERDNNDAPTVRELLEILGSDRDKYERLARGEEYNRKDYSANEIQAAKLLHTANKTENPERYLESLNPFHDNQLNYALANTNLKGFVNRDQPNTTIMRRMDASTLPHELTHSLQLHDENRGNKISRELYPYVSNLNSETQDKIFGKADNRFANPKEVYANLNAYALLQNAAGGDFVNSPEGRALLPDRKSQGQYYANTMPGVQSIYGYREDSKIPEDKFKRDSRDSYATQLAKYAKHKTKDYAMGGQLGGYSDGGQLLRGPGDGVSDDIPAQIGNRQPARLADGEFVVPARIVSELGNGSTDAGAKRLYAMMDRIQKNRGKTVGKDKVAINSRSDKYLPA